MTSMGLLSPNLYFNDRSNGFRDNRSKIQESTKMSGFTANVILRQIFTFLNMEKGIFASLFKIW